MKLQLRVPKMTSEEKIVEVVDVTAVPSWVLGQGKNCADCRFELADKVCIVVLTKDMGIFPFHDKCFNAQIYKREAPTTLQTGEAND